MAGWPGFAYQIPEIALKASITYRSEIKHNASSTETSKLPFGKIVNSPVEAITPQSVNLDFTNWYCKKYISIREFTLGALG